MSQPPLLPDEALFRVQRLARRDGLSMLVIAGLFAVLAALAGDFIGAITGLLVAGAGALELHGAALLNDGWARGMNWLVGSQVFLLATILCYCALRLLHHEVPPIPEEMRSLIDLSSSELGMTTEQYLQTVYRVGLWLVVVLSLIYQGGMIIYYLRRRAAVARALTETSGPA